jgi:hypothetical protein
MPITQFCKTASAFFKISLISDDFASSLSPFSNRFKMNFSDSLFEVLGLSPSSMNENKTLSSSNLEQFGWVCVYGNEVRVGIGSGEISKFFIMEVTMGLSSMLGSLTYLSIGTSLTTAFAFPRFLLRLRRKSQRVSGSPCCDGLLVTFSLLVRGALE